MTDRRLDNLANMISALPADRRGLLGNDLQKDFYSVQEVAQWLGVHVETVRRWIAAGRLKSVQVGRYHRIPRSELERLLGEAGR